MCCVCVCVCVCVCAGLNDLDVEGEWLVQRQVLWKVPSELVKERGGDQPSRARREQWTILPDDSEREEVSLSLPLSLSPRTDSPPLSSLCSM